MSKLPHVVLNELKCADCRSHLSYGPIKILPNGAGICGRCPSRLGVFSPTYEKLAGIFVYPCRYRHRGCHRVLSFRELKFHESECSYRPGCCFCCRHPCLPCGDKPDNRDIDGVKPIIADDRILSTLRCISCSNYLSSSPICISQDGSDICYACAQNVHPPLTRNIPLETILNAFVFQCSYIAYGCENLFSFGAISIHEANCEFYLNYQRILEDRRKREAHRNHSRNGRTESIRSDMSSSRRPEWQRLNAPFVQELNAQNLRKKYEKEYESPRPSQISSSKDEIIEEQPRQQPEEERIYKKANDKPNEKAKGKVRGVVETPRGHIYATITPNSAYVAFKPSKKGDKYDKQHEVEDTSGRSTPMDDRRSDKENRSYSTPYNTLVEEFKVKQKMNSMPVAVEN